MTATARTSYTRQALGLAVRCGLALTEEPPCRGAVRVLVDSPGRAEGLFGAIYLSAAKGTILRAVLMDGNHGTERTYTGARAVSAAITDWATGPRAAVQILRPPAEPWRVGPAPDRAGQYRTAREALSAATWLSGPQTVWHWAGGTWRVNRYLEAT